jgi:hypothetical protein
MSRALEFKTTVLPGHRIEICTPELPDGIPATVRITLEEPGGALAIAPNPDLQAAERLYLHDLPEMLQSKPGRWVAYISQGLFAEGDDELAVFRSCDERGLRRGHFLVARGEPDQPAAEINENFSSLRTILGFPRLPPGGSASRRVVSP